MNKLIYFLSLCCISGYVLAASQSCYVESQTCVDNSPSKTFNGQTFTLAQLGISCWKYKPHYNCPLVDTCQQYISQGCVIDTTQNVCTETNSAGKCVSWNKIAKCDSGQSTSGTMIACGNEICKPDANGNMSTCYTADPTSDTDFGQAMAALELASEMGTMKNCYDRRTGTKCTLTDPKDPSKGVDANCECYFFQGKFVTYKNSFKVWDGSNCKIGATFTNCDRVASDFGKTTKAKKTNSSMLQAGLLAAEPLPTRDVDAWSDKGQLNASLTGNKDATGISAGNPYVYSFASSSKKFGPDGKLSESADSWATQNQQNANYQLAASPANNVINKDDANATQNQVHWNSGGNQTGQGNTATNNGTMKVVQDAAKMVSDVLDFGSAFSQTCNAEDQSKMINVGKNHCLFGYDGVPGPENNEWILYTYGDKQRFNYQDCTYQTTFWGAATACTAGASNYSSCKLSYGTACEACKLSGGCPNYCSDLDYFCYGLTLGGRGGQDCGGITGGNNVIFTGKVNCCFPSTISKIITKAAFEQGIGGRPKLSMVGNYVAQFKGIEMCSVDELANGTCNPSNTGMNTANTFQAMCERGISTKDLQAIDFSKVDFTEFYAEAARSVNTNSYNANSSTNTNQSNRIQSGVNQQKQKTLNLEGKNYFNY